MSQNLIRNQDDPKINYVQKNYQKTVRVQLQCNDPLITEQHHAKACDINTILAKALKTNGLVSHVNKMQGDYSALANSMDYHEAVNAVMAADESFNLLPAKMRTDFNNDPALFLEFVENATTQELSQAGLIPRSISSVDPSLDANASVDSSTPAEDPVPDAENTP